MDRGQRALTIVGMLAAASRAMELDEDVERVVCGQLTAALDADHGVCFVPADSDFRVLSAFPEGREATGLVARMRPHVATGSAAEPILIDDPGPGQILLMVPDRMPDGDPGTRGLAFARDSGFEPSDLELLREAHAPLVALMPHAVAATARRERAEAGRSAAREFGLTSRELEVLELLAQGLLATSIASRLALSPRTVHKHLGNIYDKLGVHDRLVAVSLARRRGLVDD